MQVTGLANGGNANDSCGVFSLNHSGPANFCTTLRSRHKRPEILTAYFQESSCDLQPLKNPSLSTMYIKIKNLFQQPKYTPEATLNPRPQLRNNEDAV